MAESLSEHLEGKIYSGNGKDCRRALGGTLKISV